MPTISIFYGIIIRMFYNEHAPPHFHAEYAGAKVAINIQTLEVMEGKLQARALNMVREWARFHQAELLENWELCQQHQQPRQLEPLS
jgi:hypothetical protein